MIGVINTLIGVGSMFIFLNFLHMNYWEGTFTGNFLGFTSSFFLNKSFTFKNKDNYGKTFIKFIFAFVISYTIAYFIGSLISGNKNISAIVGSVIYSLINYTLQRFFVFKKK
jgi:putative flippase GtrA